ncbi:MAG: WD40 repeat domain-containing protein [Planctomycetota bacterium]
MVSRSTWVLTLLALGFGNSADAVEYLAADNDSVLWRVNTMDGSAVQRGIMPANMFDLAYAPNGELFGVSSTADGNALYRIDPNTASATLIGALGLNNEYGNSLDFDASGTLFMATTQTSGNLYTVDTTTGATTLVGATGARSSGDLAFAPDGALYMSVNTPDSVADELAILDTTTGNATVLGSTGFGQVFGMDFVSGTLTGLTRNGELISLDTSSGLGTLVANTNPNVPNNGSAFHAGEYLAGDNDSVLWHVNTMDGSATQRGTMSANMFDLAYAPNGDLFGVSSTADGNALYRIDPSTASATLIGALGLNNEYGNSLDFDASGTLFMATTQTSGNLYTVDTITGETTLVGATGASSSGDLAFSPDGTLYMSVNTPDSNADELAILDATTGDATMLGSIGFSEVFGMDFVSGTLTGLTRNGELISIDTASGLGALVANTNPNVPSNGSAAIPEPTSFALACFCLCFAATIRRDMATV